ncbi:MULTISPECIES: NUDIX domain-containing protein [unclassified Kitasatospora]
MPRVPSSTTSPRSASTGRPPPVPCAPSAWGSPPAPDGPCRPTGTDPPPTPPVSPLCPGVVTAPRCRRTGSGGAGARTADPPPVRPPVARSSAPPCVRSTPGPWSTAATSTASSPPASSAGRCSPGSPSPRLPARLPRPRPQPRGDVLLVDPDDMDGMILPGGSARPDEPPHLAAARHLNAETGLHLRLTDILAVDFTPAHHYLQPSASSSTAAPSPTPPPSPSRPDTTAACSAPASSPYANCPTPWPPAQYARTTEALADRTLPALVHGQRTTHQPAHPTTHPPTRQPTHQPDNPPTNPPAHPTNTSHTELK